MGGLEPRLVTTVVSKDGRAHWTREGGLNLEFLESSPVGKLACYHQSRFAYEGPFQV